MGQHCIRVYSSTYGDMTRLTKLNEYLYDGYVVVSAIPVVRQSTEYSSYIEYIVEKKSDQEAEIENWKRIAELNAAEIIKLQAKLLEHEEANKRWSVALNEASTEIDGLQLKNTIKDLGRDMVGDNDES